MVYRKDEERFSPNYQAVTRGDLNIVTKPFGVVREGDLEKPVLLQVGLKNES
jgi:hypothetical protein